MRHIDLEAGCWLVLPNGSVIDVDECRCEDVDTQTVVQDVWVKGFLDVLIKTLAECVLWDTRRDRCRCVLG